MRAANWDNLSPQDKALLIKYYSRTQDQDIEEFSRKPSGPDYDILQSMMGQGKFRDTGRQSSGLGESIDSLVGAPARVGIDRLQGGEVRKALVDAMTQVGKDPEQAPTGFDIASKVTDNPYLGTAMATAVDVGAQLPMPMRAGVSGKVKDIGPEARAILERIKTPEMAVALKGAEREQYLKALDNVYGDRAKRSKDMGFGDKTWYHGTSVDIPKFQDQAKGLSTNAQSAKRGFFFAEEPSLASDYADLAADHGVIREGDNVTTRFNSETAHIPEKLSYNYVDRIRDEWREARLRTPEYIEARKADAEKQLQAWEKKRAEYNSGQTKFYPQTPGQTGDEYVTAMQEKLAERYNRIYGSMKPATLDEIAQKKKAFQDTYTQFIEADPVLGKKMHQHYASVDPEESALVNAAFKTGMDRDFSKGQNVLPVKLRPQADKKILAKDYRGSDYRDETYANIMQKAIDQKMGGTLFKNTYDPVTKYNRVKQNIAAVFEPNQIRSTNAAFDPRFKDSDLLLAGKSGMPIDFEKAAIAKALEERRRGQRKD